MITPMKNALAILLVLISLGTKAQKTVVVPKNFDCNEEMFFITAETAPEIIHDSIDLPGYFNKYFENNKRMAHFDGKIILGILIFKDGRACCKSVSNFTDDKILSRRFKEAVYNMPAWKPATQRGNAVPFLRHTQLIFKDGSVTEVN
jgi:hypothetical protein